MKFGLFGINLGWLCDAQAIAEAAATAERAGADSLWTGEHVVLPDPHEPPSPVPPDFPFLDPAVALTWAAAHTSRIRLATGVIILPQRNPLVLAKELASVDVVSGGRLIFGIGVGYLEQEFRALGVPFDHKGARTNEYVEAILALWTQPKPGFEGRYVRFSDVQAMPRPLQRPHPPLVFGGATPPSYRRAFRYGDGWYGFNLDVEQARAAIAALKEAGYSVKRSADRGPLEISVTPPPSPEPPTAELVRAYAQAGVHRLVFYPLVDSIRLLTPWLDAAREAILSVDDDKAGMK